MRKIILIAIAISISYTASYAQNKKEKSKAKTEQAQKAPTSVVEVTSYALGANIAEGLKKNSSEYGITINWNWVANGLKEAAEGKNQFDEIKMKSAFEKLDSIVKENNKNKEKLQKDFLENNKKNPNVKVTPSGLQYEVITLGNGAKPTDKDNVKVNYEGKTIDGKVFDSSYNRGEPITFALNSVIKGWTEGVQLMPVGSKFKFYVPSELAYGERGAAGTIEPNATLIFEIELLEINPKEEMTNNHQNTEKPTMKGF